MQKWKEKAVKLGLLGASSTSILIVLLIFFYLIKEALPFALDPGLSSLSGSVWAPTSMLKESFGILPLLTGSLLVTAIATIIAVPVGVIAAIYISEIARPAEREVLKPFIELLAALPSVVIGFFGLVVFVPLVKSVFGL
ncbi:MAG: phosphate ABC transporter permease subunit PstC, partial [Caldisericales bacterium]|nr:phosphate ABC transporter permease subunit PstC [Caldisericales bacterium]